MLCDSDLSVLLLIDPQERLLPAIANADVLLRQIIKLARTARLLGICVIGTEQNPQRLGHNSPELRELCDQIISKHYFAATAETGLVSALPEGRNQLLITGTEAHVCVLQTALGLRQLGYDVRVVADAVGSRNDSDCKLALQRMEHAGISLVSAEMVMFEWLRHSNHRLFRAVLPIIKGK
jgi:nicotinamidase-related amidase